MGTVELIAAVVSSGAIGAVAKPLWRWVKSEAQHELTKDDHIVALRKALDKAGIRFVGSVGACDALTLAHEITKEALEAAEIEIPPAAAKAVAIAHQKLSEALKALESATGA